MKGPRGRAGGRTERRDPAAGHPVRDASGRTRPVGARRVGIDTAGSASITPRGSTCHTRRVPFESWFRRRSRLHPTGVRARGGSWRSGGARCAAGGAPLRPTGAAAGVLLERLPPARLPLPPVDEHSTVTCADTPSTAPLHRATSRERSHAVREPDALVGGRRDTAGRASRCAARSPGRRARERAGMSGSCRMCPGHVARARCSVA